ncbi:MAG: hypothetical protein ACFFCQ_11015 [Promethearchaeota archaeon]
MSFTYHVLDGSNTRLRGQLAEEIAAYYARNYYNLTIYRPKQILRECKSLNLETSSLFRFIENQMQTMDFFGIWPKKEIYEIDWNSQLRQIFSKKSLEDYLFEQSISFPRGYIIEVKSGSSREAISQISSRQKDMIEKGKNLGLHILLPEVVFERNWQVRIRFYDEAGCILKPESFKLPESDLTPREKSNGIQ